MTGSIAAFTAMAIATRAVKDTHDTFEILAYRSLIGLVLVLGIGMAIGRLHRISARRIGGHGVRNVVHFTGQALWFWALTQAPLAQVFALEFSSPLWVILLSPLILGERLNGRRLAFAVLGFAGILLVANPDVGHLQPGVLAASACAVFFALSVLLTKRLTRDEDVISILFWLVAFQSVFGLMLSLWDGAMALPTTATLPWLALIGLSGVTAHLCLTKALTFAPASFVGPIDFARLPLIAVIGAAFYDEPLTLTLLAGAALILVANLLSFRAESRAPLQQTQGHDSVTPRH